MSNQSWKVMKHPYDQQEVYKQDVVFFAKCNVKFYQDVSEPNELPHLYELFVPKEKYDKAVEALKLTQDPDWYLKIKPVDGKPGVLKSWGEIKHEIGKILQELGEVE